MAVYSGCRDGTDNITYCCRFSCGILFFLVSECPERYSGIRGSDHAAGITAWRFYTIIMAGGIAMEKKLEFIHVTKKYGEKQALSDFTVVLEPGIYGLLGPNGAGKSTLMNLLTDNIRRTSGEILYNGEEILKSGAKFRSKIGYMPQQQGM